MTIEASDPAAHALGRPISRRSLLLGGTALAAGLLVRPHRALGAEPSVVDDALEKALADSPLVYVSPLHRDGRESRCHGEVWFCVDRGDVVIVTAKDRWKAQAVLSGRDRARIWVGDHGRGRFKGEGFRKAPSFVAKARVDDGAGTWSRLMADYAVRYPDEWGKWKPRFEQGRADGSRVVIRYTPISR
jgi:hypothetical protein